MIRQRPVWGYFACALLCLAGGFGLLWSSFGNSIPPESTLTRITGKMDTFRIVDDLSHQQMALRTPLNSIHFTLDGDPTVFRYPSRWPGYTDLYDRLAFTVDVWVDPDDLEGGGPVVIYRLEQTTPANWPYPPVSISYEAILGAQDTGQRSYRAPGWMLLGLSPVLFVAGYLVVQRNRRNRVAPRSD